MNGRCLGWSILHHRLDVRDAEASYDTQNTEAERNPESILDRLGDAVLHIGLHSGANLLLLSLVGVDDHRSL